MKTQKEIEKEILLKPATIKCKKCKEEIEIKYWGVGVEGAELIRICPLCHEKEIVE